MAGSAAGCGGNTPPTPVTNPTAQTEDSAKSKEESKPDTSTTEESKADTSPADESKLESSSAEDGKTVIQEVLRVFPFSVNSMKLSYEGGYAVAEIEAVFDSLESFTEYKDAINKDGRCHISDSGRSQQARPF